jgi:hypothetical protein
LTYLSSTFRGTLVLFGVALGLIGTAGVASAQEAAPTATAASAQDEDASIGDGLFIERPAPRPDPATELRSEPASAPAATPAPAPAPVSGGGTSPAAQTTAAAAPSATIIPARPTEVRGIQLERSATATSTDTTATLARTGVDTADLTVLAGALLALGALLIRTARPRRISI